jgi:hypothetical protein
MTLAEAAGLIALSVVLGMAGGAAMGVKIGAEHLGKELAALMGAFFGPMPVAPAVVLGILVFLLAS